MNRFIVFFIYLLSVVNALAQVKLSPLFSNNMVLQQQTQAPIWGKTKPNGKVVINTSWDKQKYTVNADGQGYWTVKVNTPTAGGPYTITISNGKPVKLTNVMIGEVWICSGQSNMEMPVEGWGKINNYQQEKEEAKNYPNIRFLLLEKVISPKPLDNVKIVDNGWQVCSPATVANFSAAGYFFGRDLYKYRNVPIGLIDTSWGGTIIEAWTSADALSNMPSMKKKIDDVKNMPVKAEDREKQFQAKVKLWNNSLIAVDKGYKNGKAIWADASFDDTSWLSMKVPGFIQKQGLKNFHGLVWFRTTINIPAAWSGRDLTLNLGPIDDNDFTYFNGVLIGHTEGWMASRNYKVPKELVKPGKVVIAVRVMDTGGDGGIYGNSENIFIQSSKNDVIFFAGDWKYKESLSLNDLPPMPVDAANGPNVPTFLFNAMLNPLIPYGIKGAIWYQGEANTEQAYQYRELLPLMINDWRNHWQYDFPFYIVQLANYTAQQIEPVESTWAELREAQIRTLHIDNTGMVVITDIGEAGDIHPKNKQEVGRRLALAARALTYGEKVNYSGPMYRTYRIERNKIRIYFDHIECGLNTCNGEALKGFTIAGLDHQFHWANAKIEDNTIVVSSSEVAFPVAVRYAWADNPICNLYNGAGFPASPFRTDDFKGITQQ
jgi:sialate O-acetylesterase